MEKVTCRTCGSENPVNYKYCFNCGYEMPKTEDTVTATPPTKLRKQTGKGNQWIGMVVGAIFFVISFLTVQQLFFQTPLYDKAMMKVASEINKSCPIMVDAATRLDNAVAMPKNTFQYNYTLVNIESATAQPEDMKSYMEPILLNGVKTNPQMKALRDLKTTFNYFYKDQTGIFLFQVSITPDMYEE